MFSRVGCQVLKMEAGIRSRLHDLMGDLVVEFSTLSEVTGSKEERATGEWGLVKDIGVDGVHTSLSSTTERHL